MSFRLPPLRDDEVTVVLYVVALLVGVAVGAIRGGRIGHLVQLRLRWMGLIPAALVIQLLIFPWFAETALIATAVAPLHLVSYGLLTLWLAVNLRTAPMAVLLVGAGCNLTALAVNGGYMPVSLDALRRAGLGEVAARLAEGDAAVANVVRMSSATRLNALGDTLSLPGWIPFATAFSIGDVLIMVGLAALMVKGMTRDG